MIGRREPYTARGIRRLRCVRCGRPATQQWQICSDGNLYRPICIDCDVELNRLVLEFIGFPHVDDMIVAYQFKLRQES